MSVTREASAARPSFQFRWPRENVVIGILLVMFFMLHVLAGALLQGRAQSEAAPVREEAGPPLHD